MKPVARAQMLIRRPAAEVFDAFTRPAGLRKFWLKKASAPLTEGAVVAWEFLVPGATEVVTVQHITPGERITFDWSSGLRVDIRFAPMGRGKTRVAVDVTGFKGRDATAQAIDATEGFAIVLCDLKGLLESGRSGRMVRDKAALLAAGA